MTEDSREKKPANEPAMARQVGTKAERKLRAQSDDTNTVWLGLGMMGLIGWAVAIPTLIGVAIGIWLDRNYPGPYSWTLMFLITGLFIGCLNAWHWVVKEHKEIQAGEGKGRESKRG
ncbi:MAG: AtpZ/AtpI family protein [Methanosarcina sp.]